MRTGRQYLESLRDGRCVYLGGERVRDVTEQPAFRGITRTIAALYDAALDPATEMVFTSPETGVVANRAFMKSLGPQLEAIVREESRKAEVLFSDWNIADIKRAEEVWRRNGGEMVTLPPAEAKRYIDLVTPVATALLSANPRIKEDYEALLAAAVKYRQ